MGLFDDIGSFVSKTTSQIGKDVSSPFSSGSSFSGIGDFFGKGLQAIGNYYGFDNSGKWTNSGGVFKWMDEGVGEVTGRNQSRASLNLAKDQFSYAKQQANNLINQQSWNRQQSDIISSQGAAAARATGASTSGATFGNTTPLGMGPGFSGAPGGKDFLGL